MFKGSIVALITPFKNGKVDRDAFTHLVDWQIKEGTSAVVPCGTTGESPTLSHEEHKEVVELCVAATKKRVPVIAGTGSNNTAEAIDLAKHAKKAGADAQLVVTPYYNKPTQEGLYQHYKALHDAVELPILIYNIPPRCVIDMSVDTMARLAKLPRIVGVKDATGDLTRPLKTRLACGPKFSILSGDDGVALATRAQSGDGCISVTANIAPRLCADMHKAWEKGDIAGARKLNELLIPLHEALFVETSPAPVKWAASQLGLCSPEVRLPMVHATENAQKRVRAAMEHVGLLPAKKAAAAE